MRRLAERGENLVVDNDGYSEAGSSDVSDHEVTLVNVGKRRAACSYNVGKRQPVGAASVRVSQRNDGKTTTFRNDDIIEN